MKALINNFFHKLLGTNGSKLRRNVSYFDHLPRNDKAGRMDKSRPLLFLHGFLGSKISWRSFTLDLNKQFGFETFAINAPNHGLNRVDVPKLTYEFMANEVENFIKNQNIAPVNIVGHSMGGKTGCYLALKRPHLVNSLTVVDILPTKSHLESLQKIQIALKAMNSVEFDMMKSRSEIFSHMNKYVINKDTVNFILSNLTIDRETGKYTWLMDVKCLINSEKDIVGFPDSVAKSIFEKPSLFVRGENSNYVEESKLSQVFNNFPNNNYYVVPNCGHLVHIEAKGVLLSLLVKFLKKIGN